MDHVQYGDGEGDRLTVVNAASIQPGTVVAFALFLLVGVAIPGLLVWRDIRQERRRLAAPVPATAATDIDSYLAVLGTRLRFVPEQRREACAEIEAHLRDTTDALIADGAPREAAERRAIEQLGPPADLAIALEDARHERPRVLATVGGGFVEAGKGLFVGWFFGGLLLVPATAGLLLLFGLLDSLGFWVSEWDAREAAGRWITLLAVATGLMLGSWRGTIAVAATLRRPVPSVGRPWAILGTAIVAWLVIFVVADDLETVAVALRALLPLAVAIGALRASRPWPRPTRRLVLGGSALVVGAMSITALVVAPAQAEGTWPPTGREVLPPMASAGAAQAGTAEEWMSANCDDRRTTVTCRFHRADDGRPDLLLSSWTDLRLEVWPATSDGGWPSGIDTAALGPTLVAPAQVASGRVAGTIDVGVRRDGPFWWFVLTGIDTDGRRYRLSDGEGLPVRVEGTIADWLNAPG